MLVAMLKRIGLLPLFLIGGTSAHGFCGAVSASYYYVMGVPSVLDEILLGRGCVLSLLSVGLKKRDVQVVRSHRRASFIRNSCFFVVWSGEL